MRQVYLITVYFLHLNRRETSLKLNEKLKRKISYIRINHIKISFS